MVEPHLRGPRRAERGGRSPLRATLRAGCRSDTRGGCAEPRRRLSHLAGVCTPLAVLALALAGAGPVGADSHEGDGAAAETAKAPRTDCAADDGGLSLAEGWCAQVFAGEGDEVGAVRNLAVAPDGTVYAARKDEDRPAGLALRDTDGDGKADRVEAFGAPGPAHGVLLQEGREGATDHVWLAYDRRVVRFPRPEGALRPTGEGVSVVDGFPEQGSHARKEIALHEGALYLNVGAPSNSCQEESRTPRSPGQDPCPQLERHAGIWRFDAGKTGQTQADGERFASGLRHTLGLAHHPGTGALYGVMNGRDQLASLWDWSAERNAALPAEEMLRIARGDDFGWPYCFHDGMKGKKVLAPEYGGDGEKTGRCAAKKEPALAFPAHWAPLALAFAGPDIAYVAFHGSWNRAPLPQEGYRVTRVPFEGGVPTGTYTTFAIGAESETGVRFSGVAVAPDGAVYAAADTNARIWRIVPVE